MIYYVEVKRFFGWKSLAEDAYGFIYPDLADNRASKLVMNGYNPRRVRVIKIISTFEPTFKLKNSI